MAQVTLLNNKTIPIGQSISNTFNIPATAQAKTVDLTFDATNWVDGSSLTVEIQRLLPGDVWNTYFSFTKEGNRGVGLDGLPAATFGARLTVDHPLPDCTVRAVATLSGNPLLTTITATVS